MPDSRLTRSTQLAGDHQDRPDLIRIARTLAARPDVWRPLVRYDPVSRFYARLASEPTYEAWLLTWVPGQGTEWHDHGGSAGAFTVLQGTLTEQHAAHDRDGQLRVRPGGRALNAGALRPFGTRHLHQVSNQRLSPAISLHVYAPALTEMNTYRRADDALVPVASQLVGVNW